MSRGDDFIQALKPASFRGVPFGVVGSRKEFGRRVAVHEYFGKETIWPEDVGKRGRQISVAGFLVADSLIYGGGAVLDQQNRLIAAAETKGPGKLVHPTLGELNVSCLGCAINESLEGGGVLDIEFTFLEAGEKVFPSASSSTGSGVTTAAASADTAAQSDLDAALTPQLAVGALASQTASSAIAPWAGQITAFGQDATNLFSLSSQLSGDFGRFFNGRNMGGLASGLSVLLGPTTTVAQMAQLAAGARASIATAVALLESTAGNLGLGSSNNTASDLASAAQSAVAAAQASAADPADAIRLLNGLAAGVPAQGASATVIGQAIGDALRRAAVVAMARVGTTYQPASYDDANAVRATITAGLDAEIQIAGDHGEDATFTALRALRVTVVKDLQARGATLAPFVTVSLSAPLPDVVLAHRLYRDASRAAELVIEANPVNPLFMPTTFQALAA